MKITPHSVHRRCSPNHCNPLGNKQKQTKASWMTEFGDVNASLEPGASFVNAFASLVIFSFILTGVSPICASSSGQTADSVAEREVQRRQMTIPQGEAALARGKAAMKAKDYGAAHEEFRTAVMYLPDAVVSGKAHDEAVEGF